MTPACVYLRRSTDRQEKSIQDQRDEVARFAESNGYKIVREYLDDGISGDNTLKRKGFLEMHRDATQPANEWCAVLVWDQDRFGRFDSIEAGHWIYPLRQSRIKLVSVTQGVIDWDEFTGRIMYTITQEGKHQYLRDLARNALRGQISRAKTGKWTSGVPPYAYRIGADGHLQLGDPAEVAAVQEVFRLRLKRLGYRVIAKRMNDGPAVAPSGGEWSPSGVKRILNRQCYRGVTVFGAREKKGKYFSAKGLEIHDARSIDVKRPEVFIVENAHPPIIDKATWDAVQSLEIRSGSRPICRHNNDGRPLAGLLYCGRCGHLMYSRPKPRTRPHYPDLYMCGRYLLAKGCGYCAVPQDALLDAVAEKIKSQILANSLPELEEAIGKRLKQRRAVASSDSAKAKGIRQKITALDRQISAAADRLLEVDARIVPVIESRLIALQGQRKALDGQLAELTTKPTAAGPADSAKAIAAHVWELGQVLRSGDPALVRNALGQLVERITLHFKPKENSKGKPKWEFARGTITTKRNPVMVIRA